MMWLVSGDLDWNSVILMGDGEVYMVVEFFEIDWGDIDISMMLINMKNYCMEIGFMFNLGFIRYVV